MLEYLSELVCEWSDPVPMIDMTGIGEEMYRLLRDDFCAVLPDVTIEISNLMNEKMISNLQDPDMEIKWAVDCLFTILEDEELIQIVKI